MRIWHKDLIPLLCRQHLLACWRESLGCYKIITENKKGYRNHPQTKEFIDKPMTLYIRLKDIRDEMIKRGYNQKELPKPPLTKGKWTLEYYQPWQSLDKQIAILKQKGCGCRV